MKSLLFTVSSIFLMASQGFAESSLAIGDGQIKGGNLKPYDLAWHQCMKTGDNWQAGPRLHEELVQIGPHLLRHKQVSKGPDGTLNQSVVFHDRLSFAPLRMEREAQNPEQAIMRITHTLTESGYAGTARQGDKQKSLSGKVSSRMLHGANMGLPLATLDWQDEPLRFPASMIGFDGTYTVTATWVGKDKLTHNGENLEVWMIDVHWLHHESGDIYAAGPDESGGRYWVVRHPPEGFPYVPRYQTDTYLVEFSGETCANAQTKN